MTIKKPFLTLFFGFILSFVTNTVSATVQINEIEFVDTPLSDVIRTLSELTDSNIIATPDATKVRVTIHLKKVNIVNAIKSISRINNLWYRYDADTNTYRIMTREEYSQDLVVNESENIEVFTLKHANVEIVAQAIDDLFDGRVYLTFGIEAGQTAGLITSSNSSSSRSSSNSRSNSRSSSRNSSRSTSRSGGANNTASSPTVSVGSQLPSNLTLQQLEQLATAGALNTQTVKEVTKQAQPIYITLNNEHNMMIVRTDDRKILNIIEALIKKMDLAIPQVMLEMKILNITLGEDFNSIFNFELQPSGSNQSTLPIEFGNNALLNSGSFIYEFLNSRLRANIEFLEQNNRLKVLSNPMVVASNHRETELFIGEERLLTRGFTFNPATIDNGVIVSPAYIETETELQDIGITLRLIPKINQDNTVTIELQQESSTVTIGGGTVPVTDGNGNVVSLAIDTVNTSRLEGIVVAKDNLTVAVGGLIRSTKSNTKRKVPLLSEIPIVGRVFTSDIETEEDTETVLLITPRIMQKPDDSEQIRRKNNPYYDSYNNNFPYPEEYPNRFIESKSEIEKHQTVTNKKSMPYPSQQDRVEIIEPASETRSYSTPTPSTKPISRHKLYMEMSQYTAELVRTPSQQRSVMTPYKSVNVAKEHKQLFSDSRIRVMPELSLNRGGLYITALQLTNISADTIPVDYQNVAGSWLASSIELSSLSPRNKQNNSTYLYLISALPFNQALVN